LDNDHLEFSVLFYVPPGCEPIPIGVLIYDTTNNDLFARLHDNWDFVAAEDQDYLSLLTDHVAAMVRELGGRQLLEYFENTLSNVLRISDRRTVAGTDPRAVMDAMYEQLVAPALDTRRLRDDDA
jgi:hypothetical protein